MKVILALMLLSAPTHDSICRDDWVVEVCAEIYYDTNTVDITADRELFIHLTLDGDLLRGCAKGTCFHSPDLFDFMLLPRLWVPYRGVQ